MTEILHAWALAPAAIGTCCLAADRRRVRAPELVASLAMMIAMMDAALWGVVPSIAWAALLLAAAIGLAAARSPRRVRASVHSASERGMTLHTTLGLVLMAALLVGMGHTADTATDAHAHGMPAGVLVAGLGVAVAGYAGASVFAALRASGALDRGQYIAMGASALLMGLAAVV